MTNDSRPKLVIYCYSASADEFSSIPVQFPQVEVQITESQEDLERACREAEILCIARKYERGIVLQAGELRWLHVGGTGVDRLHPLDELAPDLIITNTPALNAEMMADYVVCAILMLTWDFGRLRRNQMSRTWERWGVERVAGKVVTLVGVGGIGRQIVPRVRAMGMRVFGVRQSTEPLPGVERLFRANELHEALTAGDYVVLAVPLTPDTLGLMGPREFEVMKPSAFLINVCRGKVVQESALIAALKGGLVAGAALDVFEEEPLPSESELWDLGNSILTPHVSARSTDYRQRAVEIFAENLRRYLAGQPLLNRLDRARGY